MATWRAIGEIVDRSYWEGVFAGVPSFTAELVLATTTHDGVEVGECRWHGTHADDSPFGLRGVIVTGVENNKIAWGRSRMEPIEHGGANIDEMVQDTYRPSE